MATGDYMADHRFKHYPEGDEGVQEVGLALDDHGAGRRRGRPRGRVPGRHRDRDAFGDDALRLLDALAGQAAVALANARLVDRLATSQGALERTADAERALREIARRLMTIQDPAELLQDVVDEAARLLGSSGAVIDLLDPATGDVRWAHDAGIDDQTRAEWQDLGVGGSGVHLAIRQRQVIVTDEYAADDRFPDGSPNRAFFERAGIRSIAFAPLIGEAVVLGTLAVFSAEVGRFGDQQAALLAALADLATIAIHNAELIRELGRSREEVTRRAETERTLREIAARVTSIRDADAILGLIVEETRRVLASDGAHLTRMSDDRTYLTPDGARRRHGRGDRATGSGASEFPIDGGHQRPRRGAGQRRLDAELRDRPADPPREPTTSTSRIGWVSAPWPRLRSVRPAATSSARSPSATPSRARSPPTASLRSRPSPTTPRSPSRTPTSSSVSKPRKPTTAASSRRHRT